MIPVFTREIEDGIGEAVASSNVLAYLSPVIAAPESMSKILVTADVIDKAKLACGSSDNFDLHPLYTILVTTGQNNNDDIFDRKETWDARLTPEDKPFNLGHIPSKIIGHITGCVCVNEDLSVIDSSTEFDDLPSKFHILTSAVVYKHINSRDKELSAEAAQLIQEIQENKWFVSMEALFSNFDYGMTSASGESQIITRCDKTSFLTKHLRVYGGSGEYNGSKVGRVLRNITFSGKGLVEKPANPESIIFNDSKQFIGVLAEYEDNITLGELNMSVELDQIKTLQEQLAKANLKLEELGTQQVQATLSAKDAEVAKIQTVVAEQATKIEELTASYNGAIKTKEDSEKSLVEANTKLTEMSAKLTEATAQLEVIKTEAQKTERISTLVDKGVDKSVAETLVAKFAGSTDETFAEIATMQAELVEAKKGIDPKTGKPVVEEDKAKDCAKAGDEIDPKGEAAAAGADLGTTVVDAEVTLAAQDDKNGDMIAALASYFEQELTAGREKASK